MSETNYWKLGLFVIVCVALGLSVVTYLGAKSFDHRIEIVHLFFDEPVDGLSVGSDVRLRGIPVGKVQEISVAPDRIHVQVEASVDVEALERLGFRSPGESNDPFEARDRLAKSGFRAYLERNALTGIAVVNADFFPDRIDEPFPTYPFQVPPRTIPTVKSVIAGILSDVEKSLDVLTTELPPTLSQIQELIETLEQSISKSDVPAISARVQELLESLNRKVESLELDELAANGNTIKDDLLATTKSFRDFLSALQVEDGRLDHLLAAFTDAGEGVSLLTGDVGAELDAVRRALDSFRRLTDLLERDPGILLRGRSSGGSPIESER